MKQTARICLLLFALSMLFSACNGLVPEKERLTTDNLPAYNGAASIDINGGIPEFSKSEITDKTFEYYGELDRLGRCRTCTACLGRELMPTEERGDIHTIRPTGWHKIIFDFVDGGSLYNRCHLIAHQLAGEDANPNNLITGTRYLNTEGMLPYEEMTGDYIRRTGNHVMYRVTPVFNGKELVARGVQMEGYSVEDGGKGISFNVYCYNVQPGVNIDYLTGKAFAEGEAAAPSSAKATYVLNTNSLKFHKPDCEGVKSISEKNKKEVTESREALISEGYEPCGICQP